MRSGGLLVSFLVGAAAVSAQQPRSAPLVDEAARKCAEPGQVDGTACGAAGGVSGCLRPEQVKAVERLMTPVKDSKGEVIYAYPYIPGTETDWHVWNLAGRPGNFNHKLAQQFQSYMLDEQARPGVDPLEFDFDQDPAAFSRETSSGCS